MDPKNTPDLNAIKAALELCEACAEEKADLTAALDALNERNREAVRAFVAATGGNPVCHPTTGRSLIGVLDAGKGGSACYVRGLNPPKPSAGKKARKLIQLV